MLIPKAPPGWCFSPEIGELVSPDAGRIDLTTDQFNLLRLLIQNSGKTLSREYLSSALLGRELKTTDRAIDNLVVRLRKRLGESARRPRIIKTARTGGYFFDGFPAPSVTPPASYPLDQKLAA